MTFRAELEGIDDLEKKLAGLRKEITGILEQATQAGADVVVDEANHLAPGPNIETKTVGKRLTYCAIFIGPDKEHWYYQFFEYGAQPHEITPKNTGGLQFPGREGEMIVRMVAHHSGMPAKPFLRPAFDEKRDEAEEATGQEFLKIINKFTKR